MKKQKTSLTSACLKAKRVYAQIDKKRGIFSPFFTYKTHLFVCPESPKQTEQNQTLLDHNHQ